MSPDKSTETPLTVGDLFCGAGGFSEGFEQAGFEVAWAVDHWQPAVDTFKRNHPGAQVVRANMTSLDPDELNEIAHVDVLIGSPPCMQFSAANRGGNGDRAEGLRLVRRFLTFVRALKPKYWVMENVAGMVPDLQSEMFGKRVELYSGGLRIPRMMVLDAASFGTPQFRKRSISGAFPLPKTTHGPEGAPYRTLQSVLEALPDPTHARPESTVLVRDPVDPSRTVTAGDLRDHFEDSRWRLTREEQAGSKEKKLHNSVYGVMSYPDRIDRPSRTITATRTRGSRMTIVVPYGRAGRRTLTLRESACAQGFPIDYQFLGGSMSERDTLVGNAVPPPLARAVAVAILADAGQAPIFRPRRAVELAPIIHPRRLGSKRHSVFRRFRGVVDVEWRHDHRVELDNQFPSRNLPVDELGVPSTDWKTRVYLGYAKAYKCYEVRLADGLALAHSLSQGPDPLVPEDRWALLLLPVLTEAANGFPRSQQLQARWTGRSRRFRAPTSICSWIASTVLRALPGPDWLERKVPVELTDAILAPLVKDHGKVAADGQPVPASIRLIAAATALSVACEGLNQGSTDLDSVLAEIAKGPGFLERTSSCRHTDLPRTRTRHPRGSVVVRSLEAFTV
jgi:DNA-cytosine methyltransferase